MKEAFVFYYVNVAMLKVVCFRARHEAIEGTAVLCIMWGKSQSG